MRADKEVWMTIPFEWDLAHMVRDHMGHARCDSVDGCVVRVPGALFIEDRGAAVDRMLQVEWWRTPQYAEGQEDWLNRTRPHMDHLLAAALNEGDWLTVKWHVPAVGEDEGG